MNSLCLIIFDCISIFNANSKVKRSLSSSYNPRHEYLKTSYVKHVMMLAIRFAVIGDCGDLNKNTYIIEYRNIKGKLICVP